MNLIAIKGFPNPTGNPISIEDLSDYPDKGKTRKQAHISIDGEEQVGHIHKGAIFAIGKEPEFKNLSPADRQLVSQLMVSKSVLEATPDNVKKIDAEVLAEKKSAERDRARESGFSNPFQAMADAIAGLSKIIDARLPEK